VRIEPDQNHIARGVPEACTDWNDVKVAYLKVAVSI